MGCLKVMAATKIDARFFESTRGRIILHLRNSPKTVNELAAEMNITDNAVRAHLLALERDGLVGQSGMAKGFRKPHFVYSLTDDARHLFPSAYDSLLNKLITALKNNLSPSMLMKTLRDVGRNIASGNSPKASERMDLRLEKVLSTLEGLGGKAHLVSDEGGVRIESNSCPFADVVSEHPEVCKVAESVVEEIVGTKVTEICDRTASPKCRFQIEPT